MAQIGRLKRLASPLLLRLESVAYLLVMLARRAWPRNNEMEETDLASYVDLAPPGTLFVVTPAGVPINGRVGPTLLRVDRDTLGARIEGSALFVPVPPGASTFEHNGLYTRSGGLINESCLFRDFEKSEQVTVGLDELPDGVDASEDAVIYLGVLVTHYGHFLTESIARLWYALECRPDLPLLFHGQSETGRDYQRRFFDALGVPPDRFINPSRPTWFRNVHIPEPTIFLRYSVHERHPALPRQVADRILKGRTPDQTQQPLYLSRARLDVRARSMYGEARLVRHLQREGVRVVYPEQLTFDEQVRLMNRHEVIMGPMGSAHHSTLLCLQPRHHIYFAPGVVRDFLLVDLATGNRAHYLQVAPPVRSLQSKPNHLLDAELALSALRDLGVLPSRPKPAPGG